MILHWALRMSLFFLALLFIVSGWVSSFIILRKMRFYGYGISDLWSPTGMYRHYFQEAKRREWSRLPVYIPAVLGTLFFIYFFAVVGQILIKAIFLNTY
jgi:ABC-type Mn2+/Zn2+ transport system permease subunit